MDSDVDASGRTALFSYTAGAASRSYDAGLRSLTFFADGFESGGTTRGSIPKRGQSLHRRPGLRVAFRVEGTPGLEGQLEQRACAVRVSAPLFDQAELVGGVASLPRQALMRSIRYMASLSSSRGIENRIQKIRRLTARASPVIVSRHVFAAGTSSFLTGGPNSASAES